MTLNIRAKLLLAFSLVLLLSSSVSIYGLIQMDVLAGLTTKIYNHPLKVTRAIFTANTSIIKMHRSMKDVALATNMDGMENAILQVTQYEKEVYAQFAIIQKWVLGKTGRHLIFETIQTFRDWAPIRQKVINLMKNGQRAQASAITQAKGARHVALLESQMEALNNYAANKATGIYENVQMTRSNVINFTLFAIIIIIIISVLLSLFIALSIMKSVRIINTFAHRLVDGEITSTDANRSEIDKLIASNDEMGEIGRSFEAVAYSFEAVIKDIMQVSQGLAQGNLHVRPQVKYQGELIQIEKALKTAISNQLNVVKDIVHVSQGLAAGEQNIKAHAEYRGDFKQIKNALEAAAAKLAEATRQNTRQDWIKTGEGQLNGVMGGEQDIVKLAKKILTFLIPYTEAQLGLFYILKQEDQKSYLEVIATYAYIPNKNKHHKFWVGEGLIGEAARERKIIFRTHSQTEYCHIIQSGLANTVPHHVLIIPFFYEESIKGILEIGFSKKPTSLQLDFLQQLMPNIGIAMNTAESRTQMQKLLTT